MKILRWFLESWRFYKKYPYIVEEILNSDRGMAELVDVDEKEDIAVLKGQIEALKSDNLNFLEKLDKLDKKLKQTIYWTQHLKLSNK